MVLAEGLSWRYTPAAVRVRFIFGFCWLASSKTQLFAMGRDSVSDDDEAEAAQLLAEVEAELREQRAEEATNMFVSVKKIREFAKTEKPAETVNVSTIMCALDSERLENNRGSRVNLVDGYMQRHIKGYGKTLARMDKFRSDARVFKLTVWDPKNRSAGKPRFRSGAVYEFKKVHSLKFYHNTLQGCVQAVGAANPGLIEEFPDFAAAKRARLSERSSDGDMEEDQE